MQKTVAISFPLCHNSTTALRGLGMILLLLLNVLPYWIDGCLQLTENGRPVLFCQSSVPRLPLAAQQIPAKLAKLRVIGTSSTGQHNGLLTQYNLTGLETLTYMELSNFGLERIEADTFRYMRQLRVLDLSKNRIHLVQSGAFRGLVLNLLSLSDNTGLVNLARGVFQGAQIYHVAARNCGLRQLDYNAIAEAKPTQLSLSHNKITWLDPRFESVLKPWSATSQLSSIQRPSNWGYIDLTDNPLNCNCQLMWLPRLIEEQLYHAQRMDAFAKPADSVSSNSFTDGLSDISVKLMYQLNLTCASPASLAGKPVPRSWNFFCPMPKVVGIDINLFHSNMEQAQLTCIGQGQPPPSLAWTYQNNGQKVQRILDPVTHLPLFMAPVRTGIFESSTLSERRFALNISLEEPQAKNFTCTVWNDDRVPHDTMDAQFGRTSDTIDRYKSSSLSVPTSDDADQLSSIYRMHEVTVRIIGPRQPEIRFSHSEAPPLSPTWASTSDSQTMTGNHSGMDYSLPVTESLSQTERLPSAYEYLFTERFSLLQLLGAVIGTFVVTLALLYLSTHLLSYICPVSHAPIKDFPRHGTSRSTKTAKWCAWMRHNDEATPRSTSMRTGVPSNSSTERTPLNEASLLKAMNGNSAFSMLTSNSTGMNTVTGPSTVAMRGHSGNNNTNIPQALLMTNVPVPSMDRSATPPPNPTYWPMPEYTYTGTGSHEYDVPRPFDQMGLVNRSNMVSRSSAADSNPSGVAQSFISLNGNSLGMSLSSGPNPQMSLTDHRMHPAASMHPANAMIPAQWSQTAKPGTVALMNPLLNWNPNLVNGATMSIRPEDRPFLVNGNYAQYPSNHSAAIYSADYPTYLQTRPYPHHHQQQQQFRPLIELATAATSSAAATMNSPGIMHASSATKTSSSSDSAEVDSCTPDTFLTRAPIQQHSGAHTAETNLSVNGSDP